MAFEKMGIGAGLTFDSGKAVSNMNKAKVGFMGVQRAADNLKLAVSRVGGAFQAFNTLGLAVGGSLIYTFTRIVSEGIKFNKEMENAKIAVATLIAVAKGINIDQAMREAGDAADRLLIISAQTAGEMSDLMDIFKNIGGPMVKAGKPMNEILKLTGDTANAAFALGRSYMYMGQSIGKLQMGLFPAGLDLIPIMKSYGLIAADMDQGQWRDLGSVKRAQILTAAMEKLGVASANIQNSWEGVTSTFRSLRRVIQGAFAEGFMIEAKKHLIGINGILFKNLDVIKATAKEWGEKVVKGIMFTIEHVKKLREEFGLFLGQVKSVGIFLAHNASRVEGILNRFGLSMKPIVDFASKFGVQIGGWIVVLSPLVPIFGFIIGKFTAIFGIVTAIGPAIAFLLSPIGLIAAAIGAIFALDSAGFIQTFKSIKPIIERIGSRLINIVKAVLPGIKVFLKAVGGLIQAILPPVLKVIDSVVFMVQRFMPILNMIFDGLGMLIDVLTPVVKFIVDEVAKVLMDVFEFIGELASEFMIVIKAIGKFIEEWIIDPIMHAISALSDFTDYFTGGKGETTDPNVLAKQLEAQGLSPSDARKKALEMTKKEGKPARPGAARPIEKPIPAKIAEKKEDKDKKIYTVPLPDKQPCIDANMTTNLNVDGRKVATATERHHTEIDDRAGYNQAPWQTRIARTQGVRT